MGGVDQDPNMATIRAVNGLLVDIGIDGILSTPGAVESVANALADATSPPPPETVNFLHGEGTRLMVEKGLTEPQAFTEVARALGFALGETLALLERAEEKK